MSESSRQDQVRELVSGLRAWVEDLASSGVDGFPRSSERRDTAPRSSSAAAMAKDTSSAAKLALDHGEQAGALATIRDEIGDCRRCKLCHGRTNIVFGVGNPGARVMFVGEGPGEDEDRRGEPFVGRAGQLLTDIITNGMGLRRQDVYIANVVKCRPPNNRNPEPDEIAACQPFLVNQVAVIRPRVIVALGKFAAQTLLQTTTPISRLRGQWHEFRGVRVMPTFHPSYLLRSPSEKKLAWQDIQQVMAELGLPLPAKRSPAS